MGSRYRPVQFRSRSRSLLQYRTGTTSPSAKAVPLCPAPVVQICSINGAPASAIAFRSPTGTSAPTWASRITRSSRGKPSCAPASDSTTTATSSTTFSSTEPPASRPANSPSTPPLLAEVRLSLAEYDPDQHRHSHFDTLQRVPGHRSSRLAPAPEGLPRCETAALASTADRGLTISPSRMGPLPLLRTSSSLTRSTSASACSASSSPERLSPLITSA